MKSSLAETGVRLTNKNLTIEFYGPADITLETTDAIVNAANSSLLGGGGVDGAIHRAAGNSILEECKMHVSKQGRLPAGRVMITGGGRLAAKCVIHTVGPVYRDGSSEDAELLASCHRESIRLADERKLTSLSFPAISTGAFGYPLHEAARVAVSSVIDALQNAASLELVRFVLFDQAALKAFVRAADSVSKQTQWILDRG